MRQMRFATFIVLMGAVYLGAPMPADAAVTWVGDFETGDTSQFTMLLNSEVAGEPAITLVTEPVAQGTYAARVTLTNDATWPNGLKRVEFQHRPAPGRVAEGTSLCFALSYFLPEPLPRQVDESVLYWESAETYRQSMAFGLNGEQGYFVTQEPEWAQQWRANGIAIPDRWHRVAMCVRWSTDVGQVDLWHDGAHVVEGALAQTMSDEGEHFVQFGLLREAIDFEDMPTIVIDDVVEGDTIDDVRPADFPAFTEVGTGTGPGGDDDASGGADDISGGADDASGAADPGAAENPSAGCSCGAASPRGPGWLGFLSLAAFCGAFRSRSRSAGGRAV